MTECTFRARVNLDGERRRSREKDMGYQTHFSRSARGHEKPWRPCTRAR